MTLLQRVNKKNHRQHLPDRGRLPPADHRRGQDPRRGAGPGGRCRQTRCAARVHEAFGLLLQYPGTYGHLGDLAPLIASAHAAHTLVAVAADIMALLLVKPPGAMGADAVVGQYAALRCTHGIRRTARGVTSPRATSTSAPRRGASSACQSTGAATRRCAWRCRRASNTSDGRRPPAISAPRRRCSP